MSGICLQFSGIISSYTLLCNSFVVDSNSFVGENKLKARQKKWTEFRNCSNFVL